ncbi:MAG: hypothetical protein RDU24_05055 [Humidesulfovibrio sp.]|uniref:hypothetical protein n=1 Tax=Humidesulfovibrio sp. TaxID=2910988 RepID=UPI0027F0544B|nr:hypothetical protein [Humidesulfovibrio sp.]MDQ7834730.1 hypothetical protein [Humidesulfovibrio sp.]
MGREEILQQFSAHLGYSKDESNMLAEDEPRMRFAEALGAASVEYLIVAEVLRAANCNSGYAPGDRFVLDAAGNFIAKRCPARLCVYLVSQLALPVALINERFCAGLPPGGFHFMRQVQCLDAGVACKGYGGVLVEISAVRRRDFLKAG